MLHVCRRYGNLSLSLTRGEQASGDRSRGSVGLTVDCSACSARWMCRQKNTSTVGHPPWKRGYAIHATRYLSIPSPPVVLALAPSDPAEHRRNRYPAEPRGLRGPCTRPVRSDKRRCESSDRRYRKGKGRAVSHVAMGSKTRPHGTGGSSDASSCRRRQL